MNYKNILVTGGAGFVGSHICHGLKNNFENIEVIAFDNLYRKGSEMNVPRLKKSGVKYIRGDVRNRKELLDLSPDLIIECSAEPSVSAGVGESPEYLIDTNLGGAIHCFELARKQKADIIFLSTSRVYPVDVLNNLNIREKETRFELSARQKYPGVTINGISEIFPVTGIRSLYGATKLSAELLLREYADTYGINAVITRFSVIAGPGQFGKTDQGVVTHWLASHMFGKQLAYIGFGGKGKQVRDIVHIDDVFDLLIRQIEHMVTLSGSVMNAGGGHNNSLSLVELTGLCQKITGRKITVQSDSETRKNDVPLYITDNDMVSKLTGWSPVRNTETIVMDIYHWTLNNAEVGRFFRNQYAE